MANHFIITILTCVLLFGSEIFSVSDTIPHHAIKEIPDSMSSASVTDSVFTPDTAIYDSAIIEDTTGAKIQDTSLDSVAMDSIQRMERRELLLKTNAFYIEACQQYPETIDSLYNPYLILPFQIFQTDGMNLSEIIYFHPSFTPVPVALISNLNKFLFYGFPAAHTSLYPDYSMFDFYTDPTVGLNLFSAAEIKDMYPSFPGNIYYNLQPSNLAKPETNILWEGGVFKENILNVRFARSLAENLQIGIFSNYQYLEREKYNHRTGGIYSFYRDTYKMFDVDTTYVSYQGINPLTNEHVASARIVWTAKNGMESRLSYKYADLHNDLITEYMLDTLPDTSLLAWEERSHYSHCVRSHILSIPLGKKLKINAETILQKNVNRIAPIFEISDPSKISNVSEIIKDTSGSRGESLLYGGAAKPYYVFSKDDTASIQFSIYRDETLRYNKSKWVMHHTKTILTYIHYYYIKPLYGSLSGTMGHTFVKVNSKLEHIPIWKISLSNKLGNQSLCIYFMQDILSPKIPYDTAFHVVRGAITDRYQSFGAEGVLRYKKASLLIGTCLMNNVKESSVIKEWPKGIAPYKEPRWVFTLSPMFGRWHGLAISSQWMFSDKRPYIKAKNILSCHIHRKGKARHLFIDLGFDYWSKRDPISYAGIDTWNRTVNDLHLKTTVQIKTFRLFYKIDNLLNNHLSYVPGYYMPGLIFRWGFNWLIQG